MYQMRKKVTHWKKFQVKVIRERERERERENGIAASTATVTITKEPYKKETRRKRWSYLAFRKAELSSTHTRNCMNAHRIHTQTHTNTRKTEWIGLILNRNETSRNENDCVCILFLSPSICSNKNGIGNVRPTRKHTNIFVCRNVVDVLRFVVTCRVSTIVYICCCIEMTYSNLIIWMYPIKWTICLVR